MNKEQVEIMIESLEELNEELSIQNKGSLCFEQWELLDYLKKIISNENLEDNKLYNARSNKLPESNVKIDNLIKNINN
jgi:hypothetical protein